VHVAHDVLADGNVGTDGLGSPVVVSVDGSVVNGDLGVEDSLDVHVVSSGSDVGVLVDSGDVGPSSVQDHVVSVLSEHGGTDAEGVVVSASVVSLEVDGTSPEFVHSDFTSTESESEHVASVSVGNGGSVAAHLDVHDVVASLDHDDRVSVSVSPHVVGADGVTVSVVGSNGLSDEPSVSVVEGMGDLGPFVEGVSAGEHDSSPVVSLGGGAVSSGGVVDADSVSSALVSGPDVDLSAGVVHVALGVEVFVDHDMSVSGESHVLTSEGSLSSLVGNPGGLAGEEANVSGSFHNGLVVDDMDMDMGGNGGSEAGSNGDRNTHHCVKDLITFIKGIRIRSQKSGASCVYM